MEQKQAVLSQLGRFMIRITGSFLYFFGGAMLALGIVLVAGSVLRQSTGGEMVLGLVFAVAGFFCVLIEAEQKANAKEKGKSQKTISAVVAVLLIASALAVPQFTSFAQDTPTPTEVPPTATPAPPVELDIDMGVMFEQINTFLPIAIAIFAIPIGLVIAFVLVRFIGNMLIKAFEGREL